MNKKPIISIITTVYNSLDSLNRSVKSVLNQTYSNIEYIIIDANSDDGSKEFLQKISLKHNDKIKFFSEKDQGIYDGLNKGLSKVTGDIIGFLHADDFFSDKFVLEKVVSNIVNNNVDAIYGNLKYFKQTNEIKIYRNWKSKSYSYSSLLFGWMPAHPTFFAKRNVYDELGKFNIKYKISGDYDFMLRFFLSKKFKILHLNEYLVYMKVGGASNGSLYKQLSKSKEDYLIIKENNFGSIFTIIFKILRKIKQFIIN